MKFWIFYEISVPRPWTRETEKTVYDQCLEQVALADELGFESVSPSSIISWRSIRMRPRRKCS